MNARAKAERPVSKRHHEKQRRLGEPMSSTQGVAVLVTTRPCLSGAFFFIMPHQTSVISCAIQLCDSSAQKI